MEPARSPEEDAQEQPQEALEDILREAGELLRKSPQYAALTTDAPPAPATPDLQAPGLTNAAPGVVKYDIDHLRRRVEAVRAPEPAFEFTRTRIAAMVLGVVMALLWARLLLFGTYTPPAVDPAYAEASMRFAVVLTSKRVDDFRRQYHRTPSALSEIGRVPAPIGYERVSFDRYRLTGPSPHGPLVFDSMGSRTDFLGRSLETLRERTMVQR